MKFEFQSSQSLARRSMREGVRLTNSLFWQEDQKSPSGNLESFRGFLQFSSLTKHLMFASLVKACGRPGFANCALKVRPALSCAVVPRRALSESVLDRIKPMEAGVNSSAVPLRDKYATKLPQASSNLIAGRKRFYKHVGVVKYAAEEEGERDVWGVTLDGRNLKTVQMNHLVVPSEELAWSIAAEWDAQTDSVRGLQPATMPLTTLASKAIDQIAVDPTLARTTVLAFLPTDSTLFYSTEPDRVLLAKQKAQLEPILNFVCKELGVEFSTTNSMHARLKHPEITVRTVTDLVNSLDPHTLSCLQTATMECKSIIMGMAYVLYGHLGVVQARQASRVEEEFQVEIWGVVEGGHDMDRLNNAVNLSSVGLYMGLLRAAATQRPAGSR
jgi:ATP synthase F1 complex assembly factor 2